MANDNQWSRVNRNQNLYDNHPATEPPTIPPHHGKGGGTGGSKPPKKRKSWRRILLTVFLWLLTLGFIGALAGAAVFFTYANEAPNITESNLASENSSAIYDDQGNPIWKLSTVQRDYANSNEIPKTLKEAVVSIEDRRFYKHGGVDPIRIAGAALAN